MTHTSSLVGSPKIYSAALKQLGMMEVQDMLELYEVTAVLAEGKAMRGNRVAIVSNVGGPAILAADSVSHLGLSLAKLSEATKNAIKRKFVEIEPINPLDLIADANKERFDFCIKQVMKDENVDAVLVINMLKSCLLKSEETRSIAKIMRRSKKPVIDCVPMRGDWKTVGEVMGKEGVYVFDSLQKSAKALKSMCDYFMLKNKK